MSRKRTFLPSFPIESRLLSWLLVAVGVVLLVTGWWRDSEEMLVVGGLCVAGAVLAIVADLVFGAFEDEE